MISSWYSTSKCPMPVRNKKTNLNVGEGRKRWLRFHRKRPIFCLDILVWLLGYAADWAFFFQRVNVFFTIKKSLCVFNKINGELYILIINNKFVDIKSGLFQFEPFFPMFFLEVWRRLPSIDISYNDRDIFIPCSPVFFLPWKLRIKSLYHRKINSWNKSNGQ